MADEQKRLSDDRGGLAAEFEHGTTPEGRELGASFVPRTTNGIHTDRQQLGESFADPNAMDDQKLGRAFEDENSRHPHRQHEPAKRRKPLNWRVLSLSLIAVLVLFLIIFLAGFLPRHRQDKRNAASAKQEQSTLPAVEAVRVARAPAGAPLVVPGTTTPLTEAFLYARANGYLKRRLVDIGDRVHRGQLLAIIDSPDLDQQVDQAREQLRQAESQLSQQQAQLALARVTVERWRVLVAKGVFSRQDGDTQETNFNAQVANVAAAQRNVDAFRANLGRNLSLQSYERVTSPFNGVITQRNVDVGSLISAQGTGSSGSTPAGQPQPGQASGAAPNTAGVSGVAPASATPSTGGGSGGPLFAVAQVDRLRILVSVPEGYASDIHPRQTAKLHFQEFPGREFDGAVTRTAGSIDQNTRTLLTEVQVDNHRGELLNGMYTVVTFAPTAAGEGPLTISGDAVAVRNGENVVGLIRGDGTIHMQPVNVGRDFGPVLEITDGLKQGDTIASIVTDDVREGAKVDVHVMQAKAQTATAPPQTQPIGGNSQYGNQSITDANLMGLSAQKPGQGSGKPASTPKGSSGGASKP